MKVLDLRCANGHGFEGWFASDEDFMAQNGVGRIECPLCADRIISRLPSAPRLNLSGRREPKPEPTTERTAEPAAAPTETAVVPGPALQLQAQWLQAVRHMLENTEDVGQRFADEARRIHYGEIAARGIRGQTTPDERARLLDEGIEIMSLPMPAALKGPVQ